MPGIQVNNGSQISSGDNLAINLPLPNTNITIENSGTIMAIGSNDAIRVNDAKITNTSASTLNY